MPGKTKKARKSVKKLLRNQIQGKLMETLIQFTAKADNKKYRKTIRKASRLLTASLLKDSHAKTRVKKASDPVKMIQNPEEVAKEA